MEDLNANPVKDFMEAILGVATSIVKGTSKAMITAMERIQKHAPEMLSATMDTIVESFGRWGRSNHHGVGMSPGY